MTGHDLLLGWMSERHKGSFERFRETWTWLFREEDPRWWRRTLNDLQTLGHVEIDGGRWETATPTITTLPNSGGYALLCGKRTDRLVRAIEGNTHGIRLARPVAQSAGPSVQLIEYEAISALASACADLGIRFERVVSDRLLESSPTLNDLLLSRKIPDQLPGGVQPTVLGDDLNFHEQENCRGTQPGAYCVELFRQQRYFYRHGAPPAPLFECGLQVVRYAELRRVRAGQQRTPVKSSPVEWDRDTGQLRVAKGRRLPELFERATVLRSGFLPTWDNGLRRWVYHNIDEEFSQLLQNKLAS
ncbi:hypothetical protein AB0I60_28955 [Actinosynnema sp. NPDC050436]|uniref:hypothetical protein n=1 Tax=Actinosynnema sp. NPDC050436 TaxID=3155659 RepID=UPI0034089AAA